MKSDDCSLPPEQLEAVRRQAELALLAASAFGRFPTPVAEVMKTAKVVVAQEEALNEGFLAKLRRKAGNALKRAINKVLGVLDARARLIYIDRAVHVVKQTFLKLHETAHAFMPWQRDLYVVVEDCEKTISPEVSEQFDREANVFASEVLFQLDHFSKEAADYDFGIRVPAQVVKEVRRVSVLGRAAVRVNESSAVRGSDPESPGVDCRAWISGFASTSGRVRYFSDVVWPV